MVARKTVRTYGVNMVFRFRGIRLHRQSRQIRKKNRITPLLLHTSATCSELPYYISTMTKCLCIVFDTFENAVNGENHISQNNVLHFRLFN